MELGNLIFGNSRGEYPLDDRTAYEDVFVRLIDVLGFDIYCEEFENDTFGIFPYYWGDCTCGYEDREWEFWEHNPHSEGCFYTKREKFEEELVKSFRRYSPEYSQRLHDFAIKNGYPHGLNGVSIYCDCGRDEILDKWYAENGHDPDCPIIRPNFLYKPTGLEIQWYKYPMRDAYANKPISPKEFAKIIDECIKSVKEAR
jgi:hypothetical protein